MKPTISDGACIRFIQQDSEFMFMVGIVLNQFKDIGPSAIMFRVGM